MKKPFMIMSVLIFIVAISASIASGNIFYAFRFTKDTSKADLLRHLEPTTQTAYEANGTLYYVLPVSESEAKAGWSNLDTNKVASCIDAESASQADYDSWSPREKAMLKVMTDELNVLRAEAGLPELKKNDIKKAIKDKLKGKGQK